MLERVRKEGKNFLILSQTAFKPLHRGHFFTGNTTLLSDVTGIVKPKCCRCSQEQVLQLNRWDRTFIELNYLQHAADIGAHGYTCNRLSLLSQNSFDNRDLKVIHFSTLQSSFSSF